MYSLLDSRLEPISGFPRTPSLHCLGWRARVSPRIFRYIGHPAEGEAPSLLYLFERSSWGSLFLLWDSNPWLFSMRGQELASHHNRCPSKAALSLSLFPVFLLFIEYSIHAFVYLIHFTIPQNRWDTISDIKDLVNKTDKFLGPVKLAFWCWGQYTHTYMSMYIHIYICTYTDKCLWWWQHTYYKENNREELEIRAWVSRLLETGQSGKTSFRDRLFVCLFVANAWK